MVIYLSLLISITSKKNVGVNISVLANLAKSPSKPENVKMEVKELTNYTSLSWGEAFLNRVK